LPDEPQWRSLGIVIPREILGALADYQAIVAAGLAKADALVDAAKQKRDQVYSDAERVAEIRVFTDATALCQALEGEIRSFREGLHREVSRVVEEILDLLHLSVSERERLAFGIQELLSSVGRNVDATLFISREDFALISEDMVGAVPWSIRVEEGIQKGTCKLVAEQGEWQVSFDAVLRAIREKIHSIVA
jgi:flagellar biosynthesis/type III secretory pathway protein FliH